MRELHIILYIKSDMHNFIVCTTGETGREWRYGGESVEYKLYMSLF